MSSDLWSFSLTTYAHPGVEQACLQLQSAGVNVCLLLCGAWLGQRGVACDEQRLQQLRSVAASWDIDVVRPLRTLRTQWKVGSTQDSDLHALREQVKALELEAAAAGAAHLHRDALHQLRVAVTGT